MIANTTNEISQFYFLTSQRVKTKPFGQATTRKENSYMYDHTQTQFFQFLRPLTHLIFWAKTHYNSAKIFKKSNFFMRGTSSKSEILLINLKRTIDKKQQNKDDLSRLKNVLFLEICLSIILGLYSHYIWILTFYYFLIYL